MEQGNQQEYLMGLQEQVSKAVQAQQLLDHPLVCKFFEDARESIMRRFAAADYRKVEELQSIKLELFALEAFKQYLEDFKTNGMIAASIIKTHELNQ